MEKGKLIEHDNINGNNRIIQQKERINKNLNSQL